MTPAADHMDFPLQGDVATDIMAGLSGGERLTLNCNNPIVLSALQILCECTQSRSMPPQIALTPLPLKCRSHLNASLLCSHPHSTSELQLVRHFVHTLSLTLCVSFSWCKRLAQQHAAVPGREPECNCE